MKIEMITTSAGPAGVQHAGKQYEVDEIIARELVAGNYAKWVGNPPAVIEKPAPVIEKKTKVKQTADMKLESHLEKHE